MQPPLQPVPPVSRLLLLADEPRSTPPTARERADARVRRYRLARLRLETGGTRADRPGPPRRPPG